MKIGYCKHWLRSYRLSRPIARYERYNCTSAHEIVPDLSFRRLAQSLCEVEKINSRNDKIKVLASSYRNFISSPNDFVSALYLSSAELAPAYEGVEYSFASKTFAPVLYEFAKVNLTNKNDTNDDGKKIKMIESWIQSSPDFGAVIQQMVYHNLITFPNAETVKVDCKSVSWVYENLHSLALVEGKGSIRMKQERALNLLQNATTVEELIILVRIMAHQSLRIGMAKKSILAAVAQATFPLAIGTSIEDISTKKDLLAWISGVSTVYSIRPNFVSLVDSILKTVDDHSKIAQKPNDSLSEVLLEESKPLFGVPVMPMAAYAIPSVKKVLNRLDDGRTAATCEFKYDGARVQLHWQRRNENLNAERDSSNPWSGYIFSRNMEDLTSRFGSLLPLLSKQLCDNNIQELILEGEVIAVDRSTQQNGLHSILPFQVLQTKSTTEFCLVLFDLLSVNANNLLEKSYRERRATLNAIVQQSPGWLEFVESMDILESDKSEREITKFMQNAVARGCEGLMIKNLDEKAQYVPGNRSYSWMKLKHDYIMPSEKADKNSVDGVFLPDTLDLIPIGGYFGKGNRADVYGSFLLAARNNDTGVLEPIAKVGTGFTYKKLEDLKNNMLVINVTDSNPDFSSKNLLLLNDYEVDTEAITVSKRPDVWFLPQRVWEIQATQLTRSSKYNCSSSILTTDEVDSASTSKKAKRGLALRFPRFLRERTDKTIEMATDTYQLSKFYAGQLAETK